MSKFEINRITKELIRAILRFCSSFRPPKCSQNNIQIFNGSMATYTSKLKWAWQA